MNDEANVAWLAGLLEGEGYFFVVRGHPRIRMETTDEDVARRVQLIVGSGTLRGPFLRPLSTKPVWSWQMASRATVEHWACTIYPWMGLRRRTQIARLLPNYPDGESLLSVPGKNGRSLTDTPLPSRDHDGGAGGTVSSQAETCRQIPMDEETQIAWLAGILEGEGSFGFGAGNQPRVRMESTDEDIVRRVTTIARCGNEYGPFLHTRSTKLAWTWELSVKAEVERLIRTIRPWMGRRRQTRIGELLPHCINRSGAAKTHCKHGHSLDDAFLRRDRWGRKCRECSRLYHRRRRQTLKTMTPRTSRGYDLL